MIPKTSKKSFCQEAKIMEADFAGRRPLVRLPQFDNHDVESTLLMMTTMMMTMIITDDDDDDGDGDANLAGRSPLARLPRWPGRDEGQEEGRELRRRPSLT